MVEMGYYSQLLKPVRIRIIINFWGINGSIRTLRAYKHYFWHPSMAEHELFPKILLISSKSPSITH